MFKQEVKKGLRNGEMKVTIPRKTLPYFFGFKRKEKGLEILLIFQKLIITTYEIQNKILK